MTSISSVPAVELNDGNTIPQLGFGVFQVSDDQAYDAVGEALRVGYRSIDTARIYENETGTGRALADSGVAREDLFVTTKLWNSDQGYDSTLRAFDDSLARLGLDYLDLYLIHWPAPAQDRYVDTFKAFQQLKADGRVRSIGVSNFTAENLERLVEAVGETPVLNQIELHPDFAQAHLRSVHADMGIVTEAWSPLGQGTTLTNPTIREIADAHGRTPAQVILRWHIQLGNVVIPKSVTPERIASNFDVFDFELTADDMFAIASLDSPDGRLGPDPVEFG
ncbi:oxidoreductase [Prescottella equi]|uniref:aldo/keto reductase n=1 Tax=Rhodococcus hoagii TaxID=43767 RepID=UPI000A10D40C|nr:aldo/keto reductase [Prescottella equi]MBM4734559.1 aldo/keto reductase [Prescottella equi]ORL32587.1 oxidoreductase [Prescottella equi]ORL91044.1 oxidoreductase [Prescottella equi]ORM13957.1 oxidoreductase [Prescottella equi]ORM22932.1 oxidoreductase [Prescottella equi]